VDLRARAYTTRERDAKPDALAATPSNEGPTKFGLTDRLTCPSKTEVVGSSPTGWFADRSSVGRALIEHIDLCPCR
jgi:hypothetical protein